MNAIELVVKEDVSQCGVPPTDVDARSMWSSMAKKKRKRGVPPTDVDAQLKLVDSKPKRERVVKISCRGGSQKRREANTKSIRGQSAIA